MKSEIRERMKMLRRALTAEEINEKSAAAVSALFSLEEFKEARTVMVYIPSFKEIDTRPVIKKLLHEGRRVVVPVSDTGTHTITPSYIGNMDELVKGAYGIPEPAIIKKAELSDIELIIVPGLAFDLRGARCGFGAGYYDRLLRMSSAVKIGLCYDFQIEDRLKTEAHDIAMDIVISERRIIYAV